ncbi:MAG: dihydrodipicolinate synthase family protein [Silicimonas sp.]
MKGIVPSLNTPFDAEGALDDASLRRLVDHTVAAGCGGMLGLAVAGEHATLTKAEKVRFVDVVTETNAGRIPFIVSVTAPDPDDSAALAAVASRSGAAGICVQLPAGMDRTRATDFLQRLADGTPLLMVQDLDWTGGGLSVDDIVFLFGEVQAFSWLKIETQQAGPKYSAVLKATGGRLNVCGGWAVTQLMDAMARGVHAFIPTGMERVYVAIHRLHAAGDLAAARTLFERVLPILNFSNQHVDTSIRFFKDLRQAEGLFGTNLCRTPSAEYDPVQKVEAGHALASALALMREMTP